MKFKKIPTSDEEYIEIYAETLRENSKLFQQQKNLIESQIKSSQSFFTNLFKGKNFKTESRKYLQERGLI
jgi:hypothetical protein